MYNILEIMKNANKVHMLHECALHVVQQKREYDYKGVKRRRSGTFCHPAYIYKHHDASMADLTLHYTYITSLISVFTCPHTPHNYLEIYFNSHERFRVVTEVLG